jgi:ABC-2 type transport system ATP-binding protein
LYAVETERLTKRFRQLKGYRDLIMYPLRRPSAVAVENVTLRVREGELVGVLGENGAGKTTLLRMLSTTLLPTSGRASVHGHDVVMEPHAVRAKIGLVSGDERSFYWRLSGRRNLEYFAALYHLRRHAAKRRIDTLLEALGATSYADRRFDSYSSGMRQKFAIARAMLTEPSVLFLDEPTRALDPIAADEVRQYVTEEILGRLGHTVLLATHTLAEAQALSDRIAIIRHGKVFAEGTIAELTERMTLSNTVELVLGGASDEVSETIRRTEGVGAVTVLPEQEGTRIRVNFAAADGTLDRLLRAVIDSGAQIHSCISQRPTLDDVYRAAHATD